MDKDEILGTADLLGLLPHDGAELMYVTDDTLIDFANRIHAAGVREGMERAAELIRMEENAECKCFDQAREFMSGDAENYRRSAVVLRQARRRVEAAAEKIGANNE